MFNAGCGVDLGLRVSSGFISTVSQGVVGFA